MRKKIKKITTALLSLALAATLLVGCGGSTEEPEESGTLPVGNINTGEKKKIAFTFDDGPHAPAEDLDEGYFPYTEYILDKLEQTGMKATFFVLGERASSYGSTIKRAVSLGCEIGSHTYSHTSFKDMATAEASEIIKAAEAAIAAEGVPAPTLFRPVGGSISEEQLAMTASLGYSVIGWSIDPEDWKDKPKTWDKFADDPERNARYEAFVNEKVDFIVNSAMDGDIVLLHDIYMSSVDIFIRAADKLIEQGFELVTVSELLGLDAQATAQPVMYISKDMTINSMS